MEKEKFVYATAIRSFRLSNGTPVFQQQELVMSLSEAKKHAKQNRVKIGEDVVVEDPIISTLYS